MGVQIDGEYVNTIWYADDTVILSDKLEDLQHLLNCVSAEGQEMGLNININKTNFMVFSRQPHPDAALQMDTKNIHRVARFKYLGCYITEHLDPDREIGCRIETARTTFQKMKPLFSNDNLNLKLLQRKLNTFRYRRMSYRGHVCRGERYRILQLIMMGKVKGRRGARRKQGMAEEHSTGIQNAKELFRLSQIEKDPSKRLSKREEEELKELDEEYALLYT
ncbi:hypothetical protein HUJ04_000552 [Dendroctonus ponderosae]|nr:hypothetical protein HUJ04_000552 [Dendroctonus ponderosae]